MSSFLSRNRKTWTELEELVNKAGKSARSLSVEELSRLDTLYRQTTINLSQVASNTSDQQLINYLNGLTARAHSLIYLPPRQNIFGGVVQFFAVGFARLIARYWRYHLVALLLFLSGGVVAYYATLSDPLFGYALMPQMLEGRGPGATKEQLLTVLRSGRDQGSGEKFIFASMLFNNNFKVGILSMALGILAGIPTMFLLFYNGCVMGVFVAVHHQNQINSEMWAWILPHGITEMGAIVLCGGVGLAIGKAFVAPGRLTREEALRRAGTATALMLIGSCAMLIAAAIIESYLRQSHMSTTGRMVFAAGTLAFWSVYIGIGFYLERADKEPSSSGEKESQDVAAENA